MLFLYYLKPKRQARTIMSNLSPPPVLNLYHLETQVWVFLRSRPSSPPVIAAIPYTASQHNCGMVHRSSPTFHSTLGCSYKVCCTALRTHYGINLCLPLRQPSQFYVPVLQYADTYTHSPRALPLPQLAALAQTTIGAGTGTKGLPFLSQEHAFNCCSCSTVFRRYRGPARSPFCRLSR